MIRKYRIDFRWASGFQISPYCTEGIIVEAYTAEDALVQARIDIDEITRQYGPTIGWEGRWMITKIAPVSDDQDINAAIEAEREACEKIGKDQATERWHQATIAERNGYKDEAYGCRLMATQATNIVEKIRARSEG